MRDQISEAARTYDKIALKYLEKFYKPSDHIDRFISFLPKNGKVLDVGCGPGADSEYLKRKGFDVEGIDLSSKMIKLAKNRVKSIKFQVMDMRSLRYPDRYFDGLLAAFSLIHIPKKDTLKAIKELKRVLKLNGIIYLGLQGGKGEKILEEPLNPKYKIFLHLFAMREIAGLLRKNGFKILFTAKREPKNTKEFKFDKLFIIAKKLR